MTSPFDHITLDKAALARAAEEYRRNLTAQAKQFSPPLTTMPPMYGATVAPSLTEADVRRIVREELDTRSPAPSVLDVTPEDVRAWLPGGLCR